MSEYEVCKIEVVWDDSFLRRHFLDMKALSVVAKVESQTIASELVTKAEEGNFRRARRDLVLRLAQQGWDPLTSDQYGEVTTMRRPKSAASSAAPVSQESDPKVLYEYLGHLRDAGILTPEEFESKVMLVTRLLAEELAKRAKR